MTTAAMGFRAVLEVALWILGAGAALVAVVLVLAFVAWAFGVWSNRAEWTKSPHNAQVDAILADMDRIEAKAKAEATRDAFPTDHGPGDPMKRTR